MCLEEKNIWKKEKVRSYSSSIFQKKNKLTFKTFSRALYSQ